MRSTLSLVVLAGLARAALAQPAAGSGSNAQSVSVDDIVLQGASTGSADDATQTGHGDSTPATGTVRAGVYHDSDSTTVWRVLGAASDTWGKITGSLSFDIDAVSSASVDVRSSPALSMVDTMTTASGRSSTSGGEMTDTRYEVTGAAGYNDTSGHVANLTAAAATERDYTSISGGLNGSYDLAERTTTLLGGFTVTDNWVSSVLDPTLHRKMFALGWSAGIARVLTRNDAIRLRYDGKLSDGYQASPYRQVRFGNWDATATATQITFTNTIGSPDGLPETLPSLRVSHAVVGEWVHALATGVGLHGEVRGGHDSWDVNSLGAELDLRLAYPTWRLQLGYRFYTQTHASFYESKYTMDPSAYTYWTSDKELGDETGHLARLNFAVVVLPADSPGDRRLLFTIQLDGAHYSYPGFLLLPSRDSLFGMIGLSWEL